MGDGGGESYAQHVMFPERNVPHQWVQYFSFEVLIHIQPFLYVKHNLSSFSLPRNLEKKHAESFSLWTFTFTYMKRLCENKKHLH